MRTIGDLNQRIRLYYGRAQIEAGNGSINPEYLGDYAAEIYNRSEKTFAAAASEYVESLLFATIRTPLTYKPAPLMRMEWQGNLYEVIEAVPNMPMKGFTRLRCHLIKMGGTNGA